MNILNEYQRVMKAEARLLGENGTNLSSSIFIHSADEVEKLVWRISEIAKAAFLPRGYVARYGINQAKVAEESTSAHTNLVMALVDAALLYEYGDDFGEPESEWSRTIDGYSYREIMEAVRLHDLPENETGDIPDNGARDEAKKEAQEADYLYRFLRTYPARGGGRFPSRVLQLLSSMRDCSSETGRLLYVADKTAAVIITLTYDLVGRPPMMHIENPEASERDKAEMERCDWSENGYRKASEMWTLDHFSIRKIAEYDDIGIFRAIVVMYTLKVNGHWYQWREKEYDSYGP